MPGSSNVATLLKQALGAVVEAGIPPELQPVAFEKAVDLFAGAGSPAKASEKPEQENDSGGPVGGSDSLSERGSTTDSTPLGRLADRLKLSAETVGDVFHHDSDGLHIVVGTAKFEPAKAAGARQVALLVAAGRQGSGAEEWTPVKAIREVVTDFNRFDSANFAYTITKMDGAFRFRGSAQSREVKVSRQGYEEASALVNRLAGGEQS